ncbi:hypothetical protein LJR234_003551 [Mesorhizobium amorphae]|uniref:hypothetical protein n=1 Tax=Mesorhizobium amorphae TaxID=71433 RepID=UPI003ED0DC9A
MPIDARFIRTRVAEDLHVRLGKRWFNSGSPKLIVASTNNHTDFSIELDCYTDRRYGEYECTISVVLKWKKFAKLFRELAHWYNAKFQGTVRPGNMTFAGVNFDRIHGSPSRDLFWIANEQDVDAFTARCVDDLDGKVGDWIRRWFTWPSALDVMDAEPDLCGAWRDTAYYCLMEQVHGSGAACDWVRGIDAAGWPEWQAAQVEYLQSQVCACDGIRSPH